MKFQKIMPKKITELPTFSAEFLDPDEVIVPICEVIKGQHYSLLGGKHIVKITDLVNLIVEEVLKSGKVIMKQDENDFIFLRKD